MQVFKLYFKIVKKELGIILMIIGIYMAIVLVMADAGSKQTNFENYSLNINIVDQDNSAESKALKDYIGNNQNIVDAGSDKNDILDGLYYETIDYSLTIKQGYGEKIAQGNTDNLFESSKIPNSFEAELFDNELDEYVKTISAYIAGGSDFSQASARAIDTLSNQVEITKENFSSHSGKLSGNLGNYFGYLPFIFLTIFIHVLCNVLTTLNGKEVGKRLDCSGITLSSKGFQILGASILFVLGIWLIFALTACLYSQGNMSERFWLCMLNSLVFAVVSAVIALLISAFSPDNRITSFIAVTVSLGMSFLCGVFVSSDLLGEGVKSAASFLPAYWYTKANDMAAEMAGRSFDLNQFFVCIGIQLLFAAAAFMLYMLILKLKREES